MRHRLLVPLATLLLGLLAAPAPRPVRAEGDDAGPPPPVHHALVQRKVGFYAVYLPPDYEAPESAERRWPVCVILHGSGSTETAHGSLSTVFGREGVIYVAPRAPHVSIERVKESGEPGYTAWPDYPEAWGGWDDETFPKEEVEKLEVERLYTDWIADCVADVRARYRTDGERVVVVGHSQGAAFAHLLALHRPELVRAYFAYAGYYEDTLEDELTAVILGKHQIRPVLVHSEGDEVVPVEETRKLSAYLDQHGIEHETIIRPGGGHGFTSAATRAAQVFVARECRGEELPPLRGELVVSSVAEGSQAAAAGLEAGDVITGYAGAAITCLDDLRAAIAGLAEDATEVVLAWRRGEEEHEATLRPGQIGVVLTDR